MDTAALVQGEWIVRPLKEPEIEMFEKMAQALSLVISPFVILPPNSVQIGFRGTAALQWDINIDTLVRKLCDHGILFTQPHLWNDIEYDQNKCALATARNTITLMRILRICLRLSDAYMPFTVLQAVLLATKRLCQMRYWPLDASLRRSTICTDASHRLCQGRRMAT